jgi:predicted nucleic acid-binding protein
LILVDSSVWIAHLRDEHVPEVRTLSELITAEADIVVGDLILCEVLSGVVSDRVAARVERELRRFDVVQVCDDAIAVEAAANYRKLRAKGVTVRKTVYLLIGTYCIWEDAELLHRDRHFDAMEKHLGLRVLHA